MPVARYGIYQQPVLYVGIDTASGIDDREIYSRVADAFNYKKSPENYNG
ncbi:MAG: hypothetical protein WCE54_04845 [Ignavibacteriaceae bacterium]